MKYILRSRVHNGYESCLLLYLLHNILYESVANRYTVLLGE